MESVHRQPLLLSNQYWTITRQTRLRRKQQKFKIDFVDRLNWYSHVDFVYVTIPKMRFDLSDTTKFNHYDILDTIGKHIVYHNVRGFIQAKFINYEYNREDKLYLNHLKSYLVMV